MSARGNTGDGQPRGDAAYQRYRARTARDGWRRRLPWCTRHGSQFARVAVREGRCAAARGPTATGGRAGQCEDAVGSVYTR